MDQYPYNYILKFGKHKGKPLGTIVTCDRQYLEWLSRKQLDYAEVRNAITAILEMTTSTQFTPTSLFLHPGPSEFTETTQPLSVDDTNPRYRVPLSERDYGFKYNDYINFPAETIMHSLQQLNVDLRTIQQIVTNLSHPSRNLNSLICNFVEKYLQSIHKSEIELSYTFPMWIANLDRKEILRFCLEWQYGINDRDLTFRHYPRQRDRVTDYVIDQMMRGSSINDIVKRLRTKPASDNNLYVKFPKKTPIETPYYHQFIMLGLGIQKVGIYKTRKMESLLGMFYNDKIMSAIDFNARIGRWKEIFYKFVMNPYAWYKIDLHTCDRVLMLTGRSLEQFSRERTFAHLSRLIYVKMKELKWDCAPVWMCRREVDGFDLNNQFNPNYREELTANYGLIQYRDNIFLLHVHEQEESITRFVINNYNLSIRLLASEDDLDLSTISPPPTPEQRAAVIHALSRSLTVITGLAGTGKTTAIKCIVEQLLRTCKKFQICTLSGKAVDRIRKVLLESNMPTKDQDDCSFVRTIHSLYHTLLNRREEGGEINLDYVIIDEASMIDLSLLAKLIQFFVNKSVCFVFLGDINQLIPMRYGRPFEEMIYTRCIDTIPLTRNLRSYNGQDDPIIVNANKIVTDRQSYRAQSAPNFQIITVDDIGFADVLIKYNLMTLEKVQECKIITPRKNTAIRMNQYLSSRLNPNPTQSRNVRTFIRDKNNIPEAVKMKFSIGDPVIFTKNKKYNRLENENSPKERLQIYNGNEGIIVDFIVKDNYNYLCVDVNGDRIEVPMELVTNTVIDVLFEIKHVLLSYCITIHKAQGSEWKNIYYYVDGMPNKRFLNCRMTYTAITRSKQICLIGESQAGLFEECARMEVCQHYGGLKQRIMDELHRQQPMAASSTD